MIVGANNTPNDIEIAPASEADIGYIDDLQRKNSEELAFYPKIVFEREVLARRIILARVNNDPCGYIYHGAFGPQLKIHQACIQYDLRGQLYGAALIRFLVSLAEAANVCSITLRCGSNISANGFWRAMGFHCEGVTKGGVRRMRDINAWRLDIQPPLFQTIVLPSDKAADASLWRRNKGEKRSQFMRGKQMAEYRRLLEEKDELND